jgi:hypothetical protein
MTEVKKNKLITFWESVTKDVLDQMKAKNAAKSLQRQAEIDVAKAQENLEKAKELFEKSKVAAKDKPEFQNIVDCFMNVKIAQKKFDDSVAVYTELFEESPRLLD